MKLKNRTIEECLAFDYPFVVIPFNDNGFNGYKAFLIDIPAIESIGATPEEAISDLNEVKKEWMMFAVEKNIGIPEPNIDFPDTIKYSGRVTLRIPKTLHHQAAQRALLNGVSLNSFLSDVIQRGMNTTVFYKP